MPFFNIHTNILLEDTHKERFLEEALEFVSNELGKPKTRIVINYIYNQDILFGVKRSDLGALIELKAIGFPSDMKSLAKNLTSFIYEKLEADMDHIEIEFIDMPGSHLSISGNLKG
ncbi:MAG: hypothetical protein LBR70_03185 [Lactobacillaceae bacterium]|jgi:phenylpyruvate tautomerase PptA (4-oxalocrotonate tautomerase family)|nr:hypothetical protein [Lactobacillaceae bacterium]